MFNITSKDEVIEAGCLQPILLYLLKYSICLQPLMVEFYYKILKKVEDDPQFDSKRANKRLRQYVEGHPDSIRQKAEEIKTKDKLYVPFADRLTRLARQYDEQEILALIQQNM